MYASQQQLLNRRAKSISSSGSLPSSPNTKSSPTSTSEESKGLNDAAECISSSATDNSDVFITPSSSSTNTLSLNEYIILDTPNTEASSLSPSNPVGILSTNTLPESTNESISTADGNVQLRHVSSANDLSSQGETVTQPCQDTIQIPVDPLMTSPSHQGSNKKKARSSSSSWITSFLNPTYKYRSEEFAKLFAVEVPATERLVADYSCALQKEILVHGRVYVSLNYICFYANIFKWETRIVIPCANITAVSKSYTAKVIPNAIQITTKDTTKYIFTSFSARDKTHVMMFRVWQNALIDQPAPTAELWSWITSSYGRDLGYTSEEEEALARVDTNLPCIQKTGLSGSTSSDEGATSPSTGDVTSACDQGQVKLPLLEPPSTDDNNRIEEAHDLNQSDASTNPLVTSVDGEEEEESLPLLEPIICSCKEHKGRLLADRLFPIPVDTAYTLMFNESKFFKNAMAERSITNLEFTPWDKETKTRTVKYIVHMNHAMVKMAPTIETQTGLEARQGEVYSVLISAVNEDIPYSDTFRVETVYCLTRGQHDNETRIVVHATVIFTGSGWSFRVVKSLIEKSAYEGVSGHVGHLIDCLDKYCHECPSIISEIVEVTERRPSTKKSDSLNSRTSHRLRLEDSLDRNVCWNKSDPTSSTSAAVLARSSSRSSSIREIISSSSNHGPLDPTVMVEEKKDTILLKVIVVVLIVLFASNLFLYIQLWRLENAAEEYEEILKSVSMQNINLPSPSSVGKLRLVLSKAIEVVQVIENHLGGLSSDLEQILHSQWPSHLPKSTVSLSMIQPIPKSKRKSSYRLSTETLPL